MTEPRTNPGRPEFALGKSEAAPTPAPPPAPTNPAFNTWLPLIVTLVLMPLLAYITARFFLLPQMQNAKATSATNGSNLTPTSAKETSAKIAVPLSKRILVNLAGTLGTRVLVVNLTLVPSSSSKAAKTKIEEHEDQLIDLASGILCLKTVADLDKPGARNVIRSELIAAFNTAIGPNFIQEIYFTEFAIQ